MNRVLIMDLADRSFSAPDGRSKSRHFARLSGGETCLAPGPSWFVSQPLLADEARNIADPLARWGTVGFRRHGGASKWLVPGAFEHSSYIEQRGCLSYSVNIG